MLQSSPRLVQAEAEEPGGLNIAAWDHLGKAGVAQNPLEWVPEGIPLEWVLEDIPLEWGILHQREDNHHLHSVCQCEPGELEDSVRM